MLPHKLITLENAHERQQHIRNEFSKAGYAIPEFFYGINGSALSQAEIDRSIIEPGILKRGEIGCTLSHLSLYRYMIEENIDAMLIMEDDISLTKDFTEQLNYMETFVLDKLINTSSVLFLKRQHQYLRKAKQLTKDLSVHNTQYAIGATAYIITKKAAKNILNIQTPIRWDIDGWKFYYFLKKINLYAPNKNLVNIYDVMPSTIDSMEYRGHDIAKVVNRRTRVFSYMSEQPNKYELYMFFLYCKLRKLYTQFKKP